LGALTATTIITLTLVRLTATTDLIGLLAECLLAPARGMAGDGLGVGVVGAVAGMDAAAGVDAGSSADVGLPVDAASRADADSHTVRLAVSMAAVAFAAAAAFMAEVVDSTAAEGADSTVAAVDTAVADTGNLQLGSLIPCR
jgi:hypothetical protein